MTEPTDRLTDAGNPPAPGSGDRERKTMLREARGELRYALTDTPWKYADRTSLASLTKPMLQAVIQVLDGELKHG